MISLTEALLGLLFMGAFGGLTRTAFRERPASAPSTPQTSPVAVTLPTPRVALEEEHETLPIG